MSMNPRHRLRQPQRLAAFLCLLAFAGLAKAGADDPAGHPYEFYFNLYPEFKVQHFGTPSRAGTDVGTMGTLRNDTTVLARNVNDKPRTQAPQWSNSYVGIRGQAPAGAVEAGYDVQGLVDLQGSTVDNFRTRDAFVYVQHDLWGRLSYGKADTMYKQAGDPVRMFGISSGNIVSTSRVVSGVGFRAAGETSFNNRFDRMLFWVGPRWNGWNLGLSHSFHSLQSKPHLSPTTTAAAVQWRQGPWYAALATEVHRDFLPVSLAADAPLPAATSIRNTPTGARSRDQAWRASLAWVDGPWRFGGDLARLRYTESDSVELAGKFRDYANVTGQASGEYRWNRVRFGANHARAGAGACALSGAVACSTNGLGGHQTSLGVLYQITDLAGVFALAVRTQNHPGAQYGSAPQGASTHIYAAGVKLALR